MKIAIDLQGAQSASRFLGVGNYSLSFASAIARKRGNHEVVIVLSDLFPDTIDPIRKHFSATLPHGCIKVWSAGAHVNAKEFDNRSRRQIATRLREAFIASLKPDIIHVSSLFEGYIDDAITSVGGLSDHIPTSVMFYDLSPLLNAEKYLLPSPEYSAFYLEKMRYLRRSNLLLAVSSSAAGEIPADFEGSVVNVFAGVEPAFKRYDVTTDQKAKFCKRFGISDPFILNSGGFDEHKNLSRLVEAFSKLTPRLTSVYQLVIAGEHSIADAKALYTLADLFGLDRSRLILTGVLSNEDLVLAYNICEGFVCPSLHESFGAPVLEAMSCGAAVIASASTSIPEIINLEEALFNPHHVASILEKLSELLEDKQFNERLREHALKQCTKFSWDATAKVALRAFENVVENFHQNKPSNLERTSATHKKRLAFVSPMPPGRSGVADYSFYLLPTLTKYYDIDVIVEDLEAVDQDIKDSYFLHNADWLQENYMSFDRVIYHVGNSLFHHYMLALLKEIPGIIVLHDFYLSSLIYYLDMSGLEPGIWAKFIIESHGYGAWQEFYMASDKTEVMLKYPVNLPLLKSSRGVIVHSHFSRELAEQWYGELASADWAVIPLLRNEPSIKSNSESRFELGLKDSDFVVCSFGFLNIPKMNRELLQAWLNSELSADKNCHLIFVGENHGGAYGEELTRMISESPCADRIKITGWTDLHTYQSYLSAADLTVQLRAMAKGETSAAIFDCLSYGKALILNANGSMSEVDPEAALVLPDIFEVEMLTTAIEKLWRDASLRSMLGKKAAELCAKEHNPVRCAELYVEAIEKIYKSRLNVGHDIIASIADVDPPPLAEFDAAARHISATLPLVPNVRRLFLDISATCQNSLKTGIERVVRSIVRAAIESPPAGFHVYPVYLSNVREKWFYRNASRYTLELLNSPSNNIKDVIVDPRDGDIILVLDLSGHMIIEAAKKGLIKDLRRRGVLVNFIVYDLLPLTMPQHFPPGADRNHKLWLETALASDGAICISNHVAEQLRQFKLKESKDSGDFLKDSGDFLIDRFHLGADIENSIPSQGVPEEAEEFLDALCSRTCFLTVGTLEPRKGHLQLIHAFDLLRQGGFDVNLIIVGREGWIGLEEEARRTIPEIIDTIENHPELGGHLFWLKDVSDEFLDTLYKRMTCLVLASEGEGFGLPIVEAARHGLPMILRDIPVFKEIAGGNAFYFEGLSADDLCKALERWLQLKKNHIHPVPLGIEWPTWREATSRLLELTFLHGKTEAE